VRIYKFFGIYYKRKIMFVALENQNNGAFNPKCIILLISKNIEAFSLECV
jgi:hypothetical protein